MKIRTSLPDRIIEKGVIYTMDAELSAKKQPPTNGKKYRRVYVLAKNLRGKTDLYGREYKPSEWMFTEHGYILKR